jgi:hypothetical protein
VTWLLLALLAGAPLACTDEKVAPPPPVDAGSDARAADASSDGPAANQPPAVECFQGTPRTNDELLDACWPDTVTSFAKKANLPGGYLIGMPLPAPPQ